MVQKQNYFRLKIIILVSNTLSLFFGNTFILQKKVNQKHFENKSHQHFWSWHMRATLR